MVGKQSPWGKIDISQEIAEGIVKVTTAGHGGIKLDRRRNAQVPPYMRLWGGWYEEDENWSIVAIVFPQFFSAETFAAAQQTFLHYKPEMYARFNSVPIESLAGKSRGYDEAVWWRQHAHDLIVIAAWGGEPCPIPIPEGMVGVLAGVGGQRGVDRYFLVPRDEYQKRDRFGFIVDPTRHQVWGK
jgi:hypothetical protein